MSSSTTHAVMRRSSRYLRLARYVTPYWKQLLVLLMATVLGTGIWLMQPWPMKVLVDHVLGGKPMGEQLHVLAGWLPGAGGAAGMIVWIVVASLLVFGLSSLLDSVQTYLWTGLGQRLALDLSGDLFARIQRRSLLFHSKTPIGDSISRITGDCWFIQKILTTTVFTPITALFGTVTMAIVMVRIDGYLTLLALLVAPLMTAASCLMIKPVRAASAVQREVEAKIGSHLQQALTGIAVVQAFSQEAREHGRFEQNANAALRSQRRTTLVSATFSLIAGLIITLGTASVIWLGARHMLEGRLSLGTLLVFIAYLGSLQTQMQTLAGVYSTIQTAGANAQRVLDVLLAEEEVADRGNARWPFRSWHRRLHGHLRIEGVSFGYESGRAVLHDLWLECRPGQTLALVGSSGAGKSTLAALVPRFFDPWAGRLTLDGVDLRKLPLAQLRRHVAVVLQEPFLFPLSVAENIAYGRPEAGMDEVIAAAKAANAQEFIERLPQGYQTILGERGASLSGGERQRLSIARALLKDAPLLVLDEPTSALDARSEGLLLEALGRLMCGRTTLIIAHRLSSVRDADTIAVLERGSVVEQGTHQELLEKRGEYALLYELQSGSSSPVDEAPAGVAG